MTPEDLQALNTSPAQPVAKKRKRGRPRRNSDHDLDPDSAFLGSRPSTSGAQPVTRKRQRTHSACNSENDSDPDEPPAVCFEHSPCPSEVPDEEIVQVSLTEETLQTGDYVLVKFDLDRSCVHYVGLILDKLWHEDPADEPTWMVNYFRKTELPDKLTGRQLTGFKKPNKSDIYPTPLNMVVKKLKIAEALKSSIAFDTDNFSDIVIR